MTSLKIALGAIAPHPVGHDSVSAFCMYAVHSSILRVGLKPLGQPTVMGILGWLSAGAAAYLAWRGDQPPRGPPRAKGPLSRRQTGTFAT